MAEKKLLTVQMDGADRDKIFKNAQKIGITDAAYARNVMLNELKTKQIFNRMTGNSSGE